MVPIRNKNSLGFLRVASCVPPLRVADLDYNAGAILSFAVKAAGQGAHIAVFPELAVTGYTVADLLQQRLFLAQARERLSFIAKRSEDLKAVLVVGLPFEHGQKLYNAAAVIASGKILGIVPKTHIPNYKEFYEARWFSSAAEIVSGETEINGSMVPIGADLLFKFAGMPDAALAIEICEDLWAPIPPSSRYAVEGATIIANLSASNELVGKADYRRNLIVQQSARGICGYIYASSGVHESTTDLVYSGHALIAENGVLAAESKRFMRQGELIAADIDVEHLVFDRERITTFANPKNDPRMKCRVVTVPLSLEPPAALLRPPEPHPFVPQDAAERDKRVEEIFAIQTAGLAKRLEHVGSAGVVIGLSGGLDSTLALLISVQAFTLLGRPLKNIRAFVMPGFATSHRTRSNAQKLARALGVTLEEIDITRTLKEHFKDVGHDLRKEDRVFENAQARYRTMILMDKANQLHALMVGTGDLSEIALGWNTFSGDHMSQYNVNAGVPKTLVRYLVGWIAGKKEFSAVEPILRDILGTPISPELVRSHKKKITQKTEELIGPYALHDFFLYHFIRWGSSPKKILFLAAEAFGKTYSSTEIKKWLKVFIARFFDNQWKRSVMPDGPKVGSVALSPRGDWRMPSDAEVKLWLDDLE